MCGGVIARGLLLLNWEHHVWESGGTQDPFPLQEGTRSHGHIMFHLSICPDEVMNVKELFFIFAFIVLCNIKLSCCVCQDREGTKWYKSRDDEWNFFF